MNSCLSAARELGVEVVYTNIENQLSDSIGNCVGAQAPDNTEYRATHVVMCTGAYTPKLLIDTSPHDEEIQLGDRMYAAGEISCSTSYDVSENQKF